MHPLTVFFQPCGLTRGLCLDIRFWATAAHAVNTFSPCRSGGSASQQSQRLHPRQIESRDVDSQARDPNGHGGPLSLLPSGPLCSYSLLIKFFPHHAQIISVTKLTLSSLVIV